jgi:hypothetical protein
MPQEEGHVLEAITPAVRCRNISYARGIGVVVADDEGAADAGAAVT